MLLMCEIESLGKEAGDSCSHHLVSNTLARSLIISYSAPCRPPSSYTFVFS